MKNDTRSKKEMILKSKRSFHPAAIALILVAVIAVAAVAFHLTNLPPESGSLAVATVTPAAANISYPVAQFENGQAQFFEYRSANRTIRYFILKSSDGVLRAAFDACDVCWPANKGYEQEGDEMVCRNCGRRFASVLINEVSGGCNPAPLARSLNNGQLVINAQDIEQGGRFFDFGGRS